MYANLETRRTDITHARNVQLCHFGLGVPEGRRGVCAPTLATNARAVAQATRDLSKDMASGAQREERQKQRIEEGSEGDL